MQTDEGQSMVQKISEISDIIQNLIWLAVLLMIIIAIIIYFFSIVKKINKKSQILFNRFIDNEKYIRGLFIELNETKEVLRYFVYGSKWRRRIRNKVNQLHNGYMGKNLERCNKERLELFIKRNYSCEKINSIVTEQ